MEAHVQLVRLAARGGGYETRATKVGATIMFGSFAFMCRARLSGFWHVRRPNVSQLIHMGQCWYGQDVYGICAPNFGLTI